MSLGRLVFLESIFWRSESGRFSLSEPSTTTPRTTSLTAGLRRPSTTVMGGLARRVFLFPFLVTVMRFWSVQKN